MEWIGEFVRSQQLVAAAAAVPLIVAVVELCKALGLPTRLAPLAAVVVGLALGMLGTLVAFYPAARPWLEGVLGGIVLGLAASGLYSGQKTLRGG